MGQITKRGEYQWRAKVRRKGFPEQSRTFTYKEDAEKWVRTVESELETKGFIDRREAEKNTLAQILKRYQREITPSKKSAAIESVKIDVLLRDAALVGLKMTAITSTEVARWRDRRLKEVTGGTVNRLCCTSRKIDAMPPAPDATMPWHPRAPCSGARVA